MEKIFRGIEEGEALFNLFERVDESASWPVNNAVNFVVSSPNFVGKAIERFAKGSQITVRFAKKFIEDEEGVVVECLTIGASLTRCFEE